MLLDSLPSLLDSIPESGKLADIALEPYSLLTKDIVDTKGHQEKDVMNAHTPSATTTTTKF